MVRLLTFLLLLIPSLALAQAQFSTIISPTTFPTSPTGTTPVNCLSGCAGSANPSAYLPVTQAFSTIYPFTVQQSGGITITGTVSVSPTGSTPVTQITSPWQVNVGNGITIVGTVTTSLPGTNLVSPSIPNWPVNINQVNSNAISNAIPVSAFISNVPAVTINGTVTTTGNTPVAISGTVTVSTASATVSTSPTGPSPVTQSSQTSPWQVNVGNSLTVGNTVTVSTSSAPQPVTQSVQTSPWQVNIGNTATVSIGTQTMPVSPTQVTLTSEKGMGYADRLNWVAGSAVTTNTTLLVLVKAPVSPSKLFITSAQCSRTDSPVGVVLFVALNNLLTNGVSTYIPVPAQGTAVTFPTPIVISPTTSLFMQASTNVTSVYCNAQGYQAP